MTSFNNLTPNLDAQINIFKQENNLGPPIDLSTYPDKFNNLYDDIPQNTQNLDILSNNLDTASSASTNKSPRSPRQLHQAKYHTYNNSSILQQNTPTRAKSSTNSIINSHTHTNINSADVSNLTTPLSQHNLRKNSLTSSSVLQTSSRTHDPNHYHDQNPLSLFSSPISISSSIPASSNNFVLRVTIKEFDMKKSIRVDWNDTVWKVKKKINNILTKTLKHESFNYGLLSPLKSNFLLDHNLMKDVLPDRPIHDVEWKIKCRLNVHQHSKTDVNLNKKTNTSNVLTYVEKNSNNHSKDKHRKHNNIENRSKFMEYIKSNNLAGLKKEFLDKSFDPNFIADEKLSFSGHTPLTLSTYLKEHVHETIVLLLTNGAILDFRNKLGHTALHTAVRNHNILAANILLKHDPEFWRSVDIIGRPPLFYLCPKPSLHEHYGVQESEILKHSTTENSSPYRNSTTKSLRSNSFSSGGSSKFTISTNSQDHHHSSSGHQNSTTRNPLKNTYKYFTLTGKKKELNLQQQRLTSYTNDIKFNHPKTIESSNKILEILYRCSKYSIQFFKFQDERGWTLWHHIAYHNNDDFLLKILEQAETFGNLSCIDGNNLYFNQVSPLTGNSPLHTAAVHNSVSVGRYLIEMMNCNVNLKNLAGKIPLDYCYNHETNSLSTIGRFIDNLSDSRKNQHTEDLIQQDNNNLTGVQLQIPKSEKLLQSRTVSQESDQSNKENSLPTVASSGYYSDIPLGKMTLSDMLNNRQQQTSTENSNLYTKTRTESEIKLNNQPILASIPQTVFNHNGTYLVIKEFKGKSKEELTLFKGDRIEVIASPEESSYWEGRIEGNCGWFPRNCIESR